MPACTELFFLSNCDCNVFIPEQNTLNYWMM